MKKVFLGGTAAESTWREDLIPKLKIDFFDPIVKDWNEKAQKIELKERKECDFVLYVITPRMEGVYSIAELIQDSNLKPKQTVFMYSIEDDGREFTKHQIKSLEMVGKMVKENGGNWFKTLDEVADFLNFSGKIK